MRPMKEETTTMRTNSSERKHDCETEDVMRRTVIQQQQQLAVAGLVDNEDVVDEFRRTTGTREGQRRKHDGGEQEQQLEGDEGSSSFSWSTDDILIIGTSNDDDSNSAPNARGVEEEDSNEHDMDRRRVVLPPLPILIPEGFSVVVDTILDAIQDGLVRHISAAVGGGRSGIFLNNSNNNTEHNSNSSIDENNDSLHESLLLLLNDVSETSVTDFVVQEEPSDGDIHHSNQNHRKNDFAEEAGMVLIAAMDEMKHADDGEMYFLDMSLARNLSILPEDIVQIAETGFGDVHTVILPRGEGFGGGRDAEEGEGTTTNDVDDDDDEEEEEEEEEGQRETEHILQHQQLQLQPHHQQLVGTHSYYIPPVIDEEKKDDDGEAGDDDDDDHEHQQATECTPLMKGDSSKDKNKNNQQEMMMDPTDPIIADNNTNSNNTDSGGNGGSSGSSRVPISGYVLLGTAVLSLSSIGPLYNVQTGCTSMMKMLWRLSATAWILFPFAVRQYWCSYSFPEDHDELQHKDNKTNHPHQSRLGGVDNHNNNNNNNESESEGVLHVPSVTVAPSSLSPPPSSWGSNTMTLPRICTVVLSSFCYTMSCAAFLLALEYTSVGNAVILCNSQAIMLLLAKLCVGESVTTMETFGAVTAFFGAVLCSRDSASRASSTEDVTSTATTSAATTTNGSTTGSFHTFLGEFFGLSSGLCGCLYLILAKRVRTHVGLYVFMFVNMFLGCIFCYVFMVMVLHENITFDFNPSTGAFGWLNLRVDRLPLELLVAVICNIFGALGYVKAMQYFDNLVISVAALMEPVVAELLSVVLGVGVLPGPTGWTGNLFVATGTFCVIAPSNMRNSSNKKTVSATAIQ